MLAGRWLWTVARALAGVPLALLWLVVGYLEWNGTSPKHSTLDRAVAAGWRSALVVIGVLIATYVLCLLLSPASQRDTTRNRLSRIKAAREQYKIASLVQGSGSLPGVETGRQDDAGASERGDLVRLHIRNDGRAGRFAVMAVALDGIDGELDHPYAPLHWMVRPGVLEEEIACGEERVIGIAYLLTTLGADGAPYSLRLVLQAPSGTRYNRVYTIGANTTITVRLIVSARGIPDVGFTQPLAMTIHWDGPGHDPFVNPVHPDEPPRMYPHQDAFGQLFDYS